MRERHKCQWCGHELAERYMDKWDDRWQCVNPFTCAERIRRDQKLPRRT